MMMEIITVTDFDDGLGEILDQLKAKVPSTSWCITRSSRKARSAPHCAHHR